MALSGATTPGQGEPGNDSNEGVHRISQRPSITGTSPSDCLVSYIQDTLAGGGSPLSREAVSVLYSPSQQGKLTTVYKLFVLGMFGLVWFHFNGISTLVGNLIPKSSLYKNSSIFGLVWFGLVLWYINHCRLYNAQSILIHINSSISNNSDTIIPQFKYQKTLLFRAGGTTWWWWWWW